MGVATTLAIGAGVAAVGAGASAAVQKNSADKAASAQKKALKRQQSILDQQLNPDVVNQAARKADEERARNRLALQEQIDPELAQTREIGKEQVRQTAQGNAAGRIEDQLFREQFQADPRVEALKDELLSRAQE